MQSYSEQRIHTQRESLELVWVCSDRIYKDRMQNLLSRARILLPPAEARLMIGVMDETGILQPGEVRLEIYKTKHFVLYNGSITKL